MPRQKNVVSAKKAAAPTSASKKTAAKPKTTVGRAKTAATGRKPTKAPTAAKKAAKKPTAAKKVADPVTSNNDDDDDDDDEWNSVYSLAKHMAATAGTDVAARAAFNRQSRTVDWMFRAKRYRVQAAHSAELDLKDGSVWPRAFVNESNPVTAVMWAMSGFNGDKGKLVGLWCITTRCEKSILYVLKSAGSAGSDAIFGFADAQVGYPFGSASADAPFANAAHEEMFHVSRGDYTVPAVRCAAIALPPKGCDGLSSVAPSDAK
jgi:hypothetical protein